MSAWESTLDSWLQAWLDEPTLRRPPGGRRGQPLKWSTVALTLAWSEVQKQEGLKPWPAAVRLATHVVRTWSPKLDADDRDALIGWQEHDEQAQIDHLARRIQKARGIKFHSAT